MTLFDEFRKKMPTNEKLIKDALADLLGKNYSVTKIKSNFSRLIDEIQGLIYKKYLTAEKKIGDSVIAEFVKKNKTDSFGPLNDFYMSVFQSRKPRAGKAFEIIIRTLFKQCNYPFDEQAIINGKPDFVMPSEAIYRKQPMNCIVFTAKRTLRERWRQIVTEGTKAYGFFLATLDDEITEAQIGEMLNNKIYLVLPTNRIRHNPVYSKAPNVISFEDFFEDYLDPAVKRWQKSGLI